MASPSHRRQSLRRQSSTNNMLMNMNANGNANDDDLAQSLQQLSIATSSPGRSVSGNRLSEPTTPFRNSARRSSHTQRVPSRSPSNGRDSRAATPTLLRKASMNSLRSSTGAGGAPTPTRRASATNIMSPTTRSFPSPSTPTVPEKPRPTATSIAAEFFAAELEAHHAEVPLRDTETIVVLHDAVYGHRFSRPRTSRAALSTIVERPERIKAAALGVASAYIRLGGRHSEGAYPVHPKLDVHDLPTIPFRIRKTTRKLSLLSPAVTNVHGTKWMEELKQMCQSAESKLAMGGKELQRPTVRGEKPPEKLHEGDLYLCSESLDAMEGAMGAVCEAVDAVFNPGPRRAFVGIRPPGHHCSASHPSGFCWVNNVHVGIMYAALNHGLTHAAIIDFDLHHGDGSQAIAWQHNSRGVNATKNAAAWKKSSIGYFSLHDINSYPCEMGDEEKVKNASLCIDNAHGQTVWNVHLESWKTEDEFWEVYETKYMILLEKVRNYLKNQAERLRQANTEPKAAIFFSAGFDASEWESAGMQRHQVNVPTEFYARIAQDVIKLAAEEGLHADGRIISVMEGGYSDRAIFSGVFSHMTGLAGDQADKTPLGQPSSGLNAEMGQKIGVLAEQDEDEDEEPEKPSLASTCSYDPSWWASQRLDEVENVMTTPPTPTKKPQAGPPTYFSPTQASTAKVVDPLKVRRSLSNLAQAAAMSRPLTPPPPEVPWEVATYELSKLLIPSDRTTDSCKPEDLNAEASRARRDRQSLLTGAPPPAPAATASRPTSRMSLRERRAKPAPIPVDTGKDKAAKNRRRTVASTAISPEKPSRVPTDASRRLSRRLSETPTPLSTTDLSPTPSVAGDGPSTAQPASAGPDLNVKRARPTSTPRKEPGGKTPRAKKTAPAVGGPKPGPAAQKAKVPAKAGPSDAAGDDMDKLTSGMKKIRINLITQSQKDARQRARAAAEKAQPEPQAQLLAPEPSAAPVPQPTATTPTLEAASLYHANDAGEISPRQAAPPEPRLPTPSTTVSSSGVSTPFQEQNPFEVPSTDPRQVALPTSSPIVPSVSVQHGSDPADVFIQYQPEGPTPVTLGQQEPLKWLPPNAATPSAMTPAATPSPVKPRGTLFHYTSGIPFAPRPQDPARSTAEVKQEAKAEPEPPTTVQEAPENPQA